jgi:hypothetical protein
MTSYCQYVLAHPEDQHNRLYHDTTYGFPLHDDDALFERLILEINQAGLSWITILRKAENFQRVQWLPDRTRRMRIILRRWSNGQNSLNPRFASQAVRSCANSS